MGLFRQITASIFLIFFCFPFRTGAEEFLDSFGLLRSDSNSLLSCTTDGTLLKTNKLGEIAAYPKPKKQTKKYKKKRKKLKQEIEALTALIEKGGKGIQKL
ncbi:MAG: hypothetical protein KDD55_13305, partial [Bdellovibrionales bacterium]|nr:hypothetical protein [Bdellovibrionales bacterium]